VTQEQLRDGLLGIAAPGALGALGAVTGFWLSSILARRDEQSRLAGRLERLAPTLGLGLAYALVLWAFVGLPATTKLASISASQWQLVFAALAIVLVSAEALSARATKQPVIRWLGRLLLVAGVLWFQLTSARKNQWEPGTESIAWTAGYGLWLLLAFGAMDRFLSKTTAAPAAIPMAAAPMLAVPAIFDSGATAQWQVSLGVGMALAGIALVALLFRGRTLGPMIGTLFVLWISGVIVSGHLYSEMPLWHAGVLAGMPFLLLVPELKKKLGPNARLVVRLALIIVAGGVISFKAAPEFVKTFTGGGASELDFYK